MYMSHSIQISKEDEVVYRAVTVNVSESNGGVDISISSYFGDPTTYKVNIAATTDKDIASMRSLANALDTGKGSVTIDGITLSVNKQKLKLARNDEEYSFEINIHLSIEDVSRLRNMFLMAAPLE